MRYDFDRVIDRTNTHSVKWDKHVLKEFFGVEDVLPAWVADMDFQCPQPVIEAVKKIAELKKITLEECKNNIFMNYQRLF